MRVLFEDRRSIHQELLELESKERDLAIRLHTKEHCLLRVKAIGASSSEKVLTYQVPCWSWKTWAFEYSHEDCCLPLQLDLGIYHLKWIVAFEFSQPLAFY
jgi:hypothetical protein